MIYNTPHITQYIEQQKPTKTDGKLVVTLVCFPCCKMAFSQSVSTYYHFPS